MSQNKIKLHEQATGYIVIDDALTPPTISSNQNDYNPTGLAGAAVLRLTCDPTERTITGLAGGVDGRVIVIRNIGGNTITLASESSSSSAANRFSTNGDVKLFGGRSIALIYDGTLQRWKPVSYVTNIASDTPLANGTATPGTGTAASASDHVHPNTGWQNMTQSWTYASADDPVYQIYVSGDVSASDDYKVGNKVRCVNNATNFFGIIVKVGSYDSGNNRTPVDVYGGTDHDLANGAITSTRISKIKSPDGFPLDPEKWRVVVTDTSNRSQASPAQNTWYNLGSISISIPIGAWKVSYKACLRGDINGTSVNCFGTLSTANNSESDGEFTTQVQIIGATATLLSVQNVIYASKHLVLTAKATYYLSSRTTVSGQSAINNRNDVVKLLITADCAYL